MTHPRRLVLATLVLAMALTAAAEAAPVPPAKSLYRSGPSGRYLLDGQWLMKVDAANQGINQGFARDTGTAGWTPATVPSAWNAGDDSDASFAGTIAWYRKDFNLPTARRAVSWVVRFESVNYRSRVYLNGRLLGNNAGAYLPFEVRLPPSLLNRSGANRLVVRVENKRFGFDFPPAGLSVTGAPTGGWWNYGGLLREVYLRKIDPLDMNTVQVRPQLPCAGCAATVQLRVTVRNYATKNTTARLTASYGGRRVDLGRAVVGAKKFRTFARSLRIARPRLWSPTSPSLYDVNITARAGKRVSQRWFLQSGIRSIRVVGGRLELNGRPLNIRGVGMHEDDRRLGFAINNQIRDRIVAEAKELGATMLRSHYPLHPYLHERADQQGLMIWSEIPVYAIRTNYLASQRVRKLAARELSENIDANGNHPSVVVWSVGNELSSRPGAVQGAYLRRAADTAHRLDPTRPVGYAVAGYPAAGCQPEYAPLDILGINEYFGWYPGPNGQIADRTTLSGYLDAVRQCYPDKAIMVTETGAEANREGPVEEKGTYAFQQDFVKYHFGVYAQKPWLSGALYWALEEFRVRPGWEGGNPRPRPPFHEKGLISFDGVRKPAFFDLQAIFRGTQQVRRARR